MLLIYCEFLNCIDACASCFGSPMRQHSAGRTCLLLGRSLLHLLGNKAGNLLWLLVCLLQGRAAFVQSETMQAGIILF